MSPELMATETDKTLALRIINQAKLGHPDLPLVGSFLHDAIDGDQAARYLLQTCTDDTTGAKFSRFVEDWKALVKQCKCSSLVWDQETTNLPKVYVANPRSDYLDSTTRRTIAQRDDYRCCITRKRGRFWNSWDVFPIIPLTAFYIREVGQRDDTFLADD